MAVYLGQIMRITRNDGYVPEIIENKLNGKKQVEEWINNVLDTFIRDNNFEMRNNIWERDGSFWSLWDYVGRGDWFEIIIVRAIKL